jgi:hypothetical protein
MKMSQTEEVEIQIRRDQQFKAGAKLSKLGPHKETAGTILMAGSLLMTSREGGEPPDNPLVEYFPSQTSKPVREEVRVEVSDQIKMISCKRSRSSRSRMFLSLVLRLRR